jgi:bifunctional UDP-N-acetylglucosamine pyrophosphorylase/glucosamine-1-phosphate N-acetyltransferase
MNTLGPNFSKPAAASNNKSGLQRRSKYPMQIAIIIMAAGKGTRLKTKRAKVLHEIGGKSLLRHVVDAATHVVPPHDVFAIVGHQAERVQSAVAGTGIRFIHQEDLRGTGAAIKCAERATRGYEQVIVLSGDVPLLKPETILNLRDVHMHERAAMTILTARPADPRGYGRVIRRERDAPEVAAIVEQKSLGAGQEHVREINSGIYAFRREALYDHIERLRCDNSHQELYLTDMASILNEAGERVIAVEAPNPVEVLGANTLAEMMELDRALRLEIAYKHMANGVVIVRPDTTVIDSTVEIGGDTVIEPYTQLLGATRVGTDCRIRSFTVVEDTVVGDRVTIRQNCVVAESYIDSGAIIGPFAHVRPGCMIGEGAHVGNFVETKKTRMGKGSKANHLTYLGDADIGEATNIGAGTITCNYDGQQKHRTLIGDRVFVGSDSTLVAPLVVGNGAYIAAGSSITQDVPEDALALGRSRQMVKEGWAKNRRAQLESRKTPG